jgi:hypothetical protein
MQGEIDTLIKEGYVSKDGDLYELTPGPVWGSLPVIPLGKKSSAEKYDQTADHS